VDIKEEKKEEKPPPPPPKQKVEPPPIVVPPPPINIAPAPPPIQTVNSAPPPVFNPAPAFTPPPAPAPRFQPKSPTPRGNPGNWANSNDYPSGPLRRNEEGVTSFRVTVSTDGRVQSCEVTRSSGSAELDDATCKLISRRGRFNPATDGDGQPTAGAWASSVRWQIPKD
jgi:protein TonB